MKDKEHVTIYVSFITVKGKRIYARNYGLKAFPLRIPKNRYQQRKRN